ncbi:hypothetical protein MGR01S_28170 [Meiothermus granaticius NBRC 107808]|nr:hypothetical protein MGR01S_28170 [Meiothermus granaticius NBRC 107808]
MKHLALIGLLILIGCAPVLQVLEPEPPGTRLEALGGGRWAARVDPPIPAFVVSSNRPITAYEGDCAYVVTPLDSILDPTGAARFAVACNAPSATVTTEGEPVIRPLTAQR